MATTQESIANEDYSDDDLNQDPLESTQSEITSENTTVKRKRRLASAIWKDFSLIPLKAGEPLYCECKKCGKRYLAESSNGTGNLHCHLKSCLKKTTRDMGEFMISSDKESLITTNSNFSQEKFRELLVHAIIRHDLSFSFVEYEAIRTLLSYLEPKLVHISRNTAKSDIKKTYQKEISRLRGELVACPGRICLTSDAWTSIVTDGYLSLTAHYLEYSYAKLYGPISQELSKIKTTLFSLFDEYMKASTNNTTFSTHFGSNNETDSIEGRGKNKVSSLMRKEFQQFKSNEYCAVGNTHKSQLELYLDEPTMGDITVEFDVLGFWKSQQFRYPELSKLAKDLLCVPVSTVASESAFSLGGRILDQYRSSMTPAIVEALVCTRDWLFGGPVVTQMKLDEIVQNVMTSDSYSDETGVTRCEVTNSSSIN